MSEYMIVDGQLYHHGIKGQKWGKRRYQNKDGSWTPAGRQRYSESEMRAKDALDAVRKNRRAASADYNNAYNKYMFVPTEKNYKKLVYASNQLNAAKKDEKQANLDYKVAKKDANGGFDTDKKKSTHRIRLEEKYMKQGYNEKQAAILANDRIRTEKILAASVAITVTAAAVYATNKRIRDKTDQLIKTGDKLQRIEMQNTNGKLNDTFYAAGGKHDTKRYAGLLGYARQQQTGQAYKMELEAVGNIKVASKDNATKVFGDLYKNDPDFRKSVERYASVHLTSGRNATDVNKLSDKNIRKMYENFNSGLIAIREEGSGADKKFYDALKNKGYGAIQDINDMKYSGYNAKNPLIVFDNSKQDIVVKSVKKMLEEPKDFSDLRNNYIKELGKAQIEKMGKLMASPYTAMATTGAAASMYVADHIEED